jgi:hypothetical protein
MVYVTMFDLNPQDGQRERRTLSVALHSSRQVPTGIWLLITVFNAQKQHPGVQRRRGVQLCILLL